MQQVKTKTAAYLLAVLFMGIAFLAGCSGSLTAPEADAANPATSKNAHSPVIIGEQLGATQGVVITNDLGAPIKSVALHVVNSKATATKLSLSRTWDEGDDALIFIPVSNTVSPSDMIITTGKHKYVLHDVEFPTFAVGEVHLEKKVAYLTFMPENEAMSTLEHERYLITKAEAAKQAKAAKAAKKKADKAEAAAKAAAEEAERVQAEAAAQVEAAWAQTQTPVYYYEEPAAEPVAEPAADNAQPAADTPAEPAAPVAETAGADGNDQ